MKRTHRGGSQSDLRTANQQRIFDYFVANGTATQAEIARATGLAASTVSNIVTDFQALGLVERTGANAGPHGQRLRLVSGGGLALGIEIGHQHVTFAIANLSREILAIERLTQPRRPIVADLELINEALNTFLAANNVRRESVLVAGMAVPAPVDLDGRRISSAEVLPTWADADIAELAAHALGMPVYVDNDANLGAIGERVWGAAKGVDDLVYLKLADGIGAGLVLNGSLYRGADGSAGEVGHTTIDERGRMCRCGNRGCLETVASARAIVELARPVLGADASIHTVLAQAHAGNAACVRVLEDTGRVVGVALANLANTVNPRVIVVGGALAEAGDLLIQPLQQVLQRYAVRGVIENLEFRTATLGLFAHVHGAVDLALRHAPVTQTEPGGGVSPQNAFGK